MPSIKRVAWNEKFTMYVYVPYKQVDEVKKSLAKAGFKKISDEELDSDHEIGVEVTCANVSQAHEIIESIIQ